MPPDPHIWDLLLDIGTPPEKFLPTPLMHQDSLEPAAIRFTFEHLQEYAR